MESEIWLYSCDEQRTLTDIPILNKRIVVEAEHLCYAPKVWMLYHQIPISIVLQ